MTVNCRCTFITTPTTEYHMRQQIVRPLATGLFMFTDADDSNQILYPAKVVNALEAAHQADLLHYKSASVDARDKVNELTEKLNLAHDSIQNMTDKCVDYRQQLEAHEAATATLEEALAKAVKREKTLQRLEDELDTTFIELREAQSRVAQLESELKREQKHAKQLATRLKHAGPRGVERPKRARRQATRA